MLRVKRWWVRTFRTRITPEFFNSEGRPLITWDQGRARVKRGTLVPGWNAERPAWWRGRMSRYGVTAETRAEAVRQLDEWMDEVASQETG